MRKANQLRDVTIEPFETNAAGSVVIAAGDTRVLCTASIADTPPRWLPRDPETGAFTRGWVTAEYNMLPGSTPDRMRRGPNSRGTEIQRLIGRSLRAAVDLDKMPGVAITVDCDVLRADGGTRTAAITGGYVALRQAIDFARAEGMIEKNPLTNQVAAVSVGVVGGKPHLDLDYPLDSAAEVDMNVVMTAKGQYVEVQGTGEDGTFDRAQLDALLDLAGKGIKKLMKVQNGALGGK
ncbi:MAG: ribonuclease PH [Planctomycetota bacterium]